MEVIKVSIVEDNLKFQAWIQEEIQRDKEIECISTHITGEDALGKIPKLKPDIILMDLTLEKSKYNGLQCIFRLRETCPDARCMVISSHDDDNRLFTALKVGAKSYIQKSEIIGNLTDHIKVCYQKGAYMSPGIANRVLESFERPKKEIELLEKLTKRERQVLEMVKEGYLLKEIADQLNIAENTVKNHNSNILHKLEVNNRAEAIRYIQK